jgi:hypothetical protein
MEYAQKRLENVEYRLTVAQNLNRQLEHQVYHAAKNLSFWQKCKLVLTHEL